MKSMQLVLELLCGPSEDEPWKVGHGEDDDEPMTEDDWKNEIDWGNGGDHNYPY